MPVLPRLTDLMGNDVPTCPCSENHARSGSILFISRGLISGCQMEMQPNILDGLGGGGCIDNILASS